MDVIFHEKEIKNYPEPVTMEMTEIILNQMKNSICAISIINGKHGTGFFCRINTYDKEFPVLVTNNHILNEEDLKNNKSLEILINNQRKEINLKENRFIYSNNELNITLLEILKTDEINNYLQFDEDLYNQSFDINLYRNKSIYILQYPNHYGQPKVSYGTIKDIEDNRIYYNCNTSRGSSGSPILNFKNNKVIGIHVGGSKYFNFNKGIFSKSIIDVIKNKLQISEKNRDYDENFNFRKNLTLSDTNIRYSLTPNIFDEDIPNTYVKSCKNNNNNKKCKFHLICKKCHEFPIFQFETEDSINISCGCKNFMKLGDIFLKYLDDEKYQLNYMKCNEHNKIFNYYCKNCSKNICSECLKQKSHLNHKYIIFDGMKFDINMKIENIKEILNIPDKIFDKDFNIIDGKYTLEKLAKILINDYRTAPNYNLFKTIENIHDFLFSKSKEINSLQEIKTTDKRQNISSIFIKNENIPDLTILSEKNLNYMNALSLMNNEIKDISMLSKLIMDNIRFLDLSNNKIDNSAIQIFKEMKLNHLKILNLSSNNINDFSIFKTFENFPNLEELYIGNNKFNENYSNRGECYFLEKIKAIDLCGAFTNNSINLINNVKSQYLEKLYLNNNKLNSLSFLENLDFPELKEIYLNDNDINEIKLFDIFPSLEYIEIKNNKITELAGFNNIINRLPNLGKINLKGNIINFKDEKNIRIFREVNFGKNIKIIYFNF